MYAKGYTSPTVISSPKPWVYVKEAWDDEWEFSPDFSVVHISDVAAGQDVDRLVFQRKYGTYAQPWDSGLSYHRRLESGCNWWVMATIAHAGGEHPAFVGRVGPSTTQHNGASAGASGVQTWTAYGPSQILRNFDIARSFWKEGEALADIGWLPPMNRIGDSQDARNRSSEQTDGAYTYGRGGTWSNYDYILYVLTHFMNGTGGPQWSLSGQSAALKEIKAPVDFGECATAYEIIRRMVPLAFGLDFSVVPTEAGFAVWVYSLSKLPTTVGGVTVPANPRLIEFDSSAAAVQEAVTEEDATQKRGACYVRSKRAVVVCSLRGVNAQGWVSEKSLVPAWDVTLTNDYKSAIGSTDYEDASENDKARASVRYENVFRLFAADSNFSTGAVLASVPDAADFVLADSQTVIRETLGDLPDTFTPISTEPEEDARIPERRRASVWLEAVDPDDLASEAPYYVLADKLGFAVSTLGHDFGVHLDIDPAHRLAKNHWSEALPATNYDPGWPGGYDYEYMICTVAVPSDQRYTIVVEESDEPSEGRREILTDAEAWAVAPGTVDYCEGGVPVEAAADWARLDSSALNLAAAGARQRYGRPRKRARVRWNGIWPYSAFVGSILATVDGEDTDAPITGVTYEFAQNENETNATSLEAGFPE